LAEWAEAFPFAATCQCFEIAPRQVVWGMQSTKYRPLSFCTLSLIDFLATIDIVAYTTKLNAALKFLFGRHDLGIFVRRIGRSMSARSCQQDREAAAHPLNFGRVAVWQISRENLRPFSIYPHHLGMGVGTNFLKKGTRSAECSRK
jgi:hypothetical protein